MRKKTFFKILKCFIILNVITVLIIWKTRQPEVKIALVSSVNNNEIKDKNKPLVESNEWAANLNVMQYSSYLVKLASNGTYSIESLFLINSKINHLLIKSSHVKQEFKCFFKNKNKKEAITTEPMDLYKILVRASKSSKGSGKQHSWKINCNVPIVLNELNYKEWSFAVINTTDLNQVELQFNLDKTRLLNDFIQYQDLEYIDGTVAKVKGVGHCVHGLHGLYDSKSMTTSKTMEKFILWLKMQKALNYKEIRLHFYDDATFILNYLFDKERQLFDDGFKLNFVQYYSEYADVCKWHIISRHNLKNSKESEYFVEKCKDAIEYVFLMKDYKTNLMHRRTQSNDCYTQLKYKYEFVTNYDFDEIILPRNVLQNDTRLCDQQSPLNYNIYDYAIRLFNIYGRNTTSHLEFRNVVIIHNKNKLSKLLNSIENYQKNNGAKLIFKNIHYTMENLNYLNYLQESLKVYNKCFNRTYLLDNSDFNSAFGTTIHNSNVYGKSIFNTDFILYINAHYGVSKSGGEPAAVPLNLGYSLHFRNKFGPYTPDAKQPLSSFKIDNEYYLLLKNIIEKKI